MLENIWFFDRKKVKSSENVDIKPKGDKLTMRCRTEHPIT